MTTPTQAYNTAHAAYVAAHPGLDSDDAHNAAMAAALQAGRDSVYGIIASDPSPAGRASLTQVTSLLDQLITLQALQPIP